MRTVVIFPGRFHPFHRGHLATYRRLSKQFGTDNVYVAATDKQAPITSPFRFDDKVLMMTQMGIPPGHILKIKRPYNIKEITDDFGTEDIAVVFAVSEKDQERIQALLSNQYYAPWDNDSKPQPVSKIKQAYVMRVPVENFKIQGVDADSASQIRDLYLNNNSDGRNNIIQELYGKVDSNIREIFDQRLSQTEKLEEFVNEARTKPSIKNLQLLERVLQLETSVKEEENRLTLRSNNQPAQAWIDKVYQLYPGTFQNNHVMSWGEGDDQRFAMFELIPNPARKNAVEVKWFQAYPLRQGVGSRAMAELQRLAQEDGIALTLYPWDKGQVSQAKLMKFYRGHGFKPTARGSKNMAWEPEIKENDDDLFHDQPGYYVGGRDYVVVGPDGVICAEFKNARFKDVMELAKKESREYVSLGYNFDNDPNDVVQIWVVNNDIEDPHNTEGGSKVIKSIPIQPLQENTDDLFEPGKQLAEIIAAELYRNKIEWHSIIDANSLNLALQSRGIPSYLLAKFRQLNDAERQELTDEVADVFWDRYEQHQWVPDDTPNLNENDDDLFEPTVSPVILKLFIELDNLCESIGYEFSANEIMMRSSEFWEEISDRLEGDTNPRHIIAAATHEERVAIIDELRYYIRELRNEHNLTEDQDLYDLFEPSTRQKIMKIIQDRQAEIKHLAYNDPETAQDPYSVEYLRELYMQYRDLMRSLKRNFNQTMQSFFELDIPTEAVDDAITTLEEHGISLAQWAPRDLQENLDDLFEPSLRSKIMKVLLDRQIELKDYADREVRFGSKEAALSLWMDYRELMKALNKNFDGTMRSMFDINVLHNLPENAVDDAIDTLEREQFNLERWVNPDYLPE